MIQSGKGNAYKYNLRLKFNYGCLFSFSSLGVSKFLSLRFQVLGVSETNRRNSCAQKRFSNSFCFKLNHMIHRSFTRLGEKCKWIITVNSGVNRIIVCTAITMSNPAWYKCRSPKKLDPFYPFVLSLGVNGNAHIGVARCPILDSVS